MSHASQLEQDAPAPPPPSRRRFLKFLTHGLGAVFGAILSAPVVAYLIDPRNKKAALADFRTVAKFKDLPVNEPVQRTIRDFREDSWTLHPNDVIGRVWLIRKRDKGAVINSKDPKANDVLLVSTTICPHLGCSVNFVDSKDLFICPCHNGTFAMDGAKIEGGEKNPAPRGMDHLDFQLIKDPDEEDNFLVQVKYQNFEQGEKKKVLKT